MRNIAEVVEKSDVSLAEISKRSQIPLLRLQGLVEGERPTLAELRRLAKVLGLDLAQFSSESPKTRTAMLFRDTMGNRLAPSHELTLETLSNQLEQSMGMIDQERNHKWLKLFDGRNFDFHDAQRLGEEFREHFADGDQVSPLTSLPQLVVETLNIILVIPPKLKIDGASALIHEHAFIFVAPRRFVPRMLFTLAHEIGHLLAHHRRRENFAFFDTEDSTGSIRPRREAEERFADAFASALLLPAVGVGITLKKIREVYNITGDALGDIEILYLSRIFGVSFQVAARRCEDLDLIQRGSAFSLYAKICEEFKNPEERARQLNLPPRPEIYFPSVSPQLLKSAIRKVRRGEISVGRAAKNINASIGALMHAHQDLLTEH